MLLEPVSDAVDIVSERKKAQYFSKKRMQPSYGLTSTLEMELLQKVNINSNGHLRE